mgnify:CR=1 FL=1
MARKELSALNLDTAPAPAGATVVAEAGAPAAAEPARTGLRVEGVGRSFGARQVVKNVSLRVERGEVAGLLGPNGAGKTTCFYMITGLIAPDYGSIWLDGVEITKQPMYQRARMGVGYLAQEASIFRVEIARALASRPSFMLLDEPFAGIDPLAISDIRELIRYLAGQGIGVLITDHNVRETLDIIDRAAIIHAGEVLFEGSPDEVVSNPEVRRVYLGDLYG